MTRRPPRRKGVSSGADLYACPASSVDTETEAMIQEALDQLTTSRTTIAIAHRLSTLRKAHRLLILEKGDVIEEGTHKELAAKEDGLYSKLLRMQREAQSVMGLAGA